MALTFELTEFADGFNPTTTLNLFLSKNGGALVAAVGVATYSTLPGLTGVVVTVDLQAGDDDILGELRWFIQDSSSGNYYASVTSHQVVAFDPNDSAGLGLSRITAITADPWAVPLPGSYASGEAGFILGHLGAPPDPWAVPLPGSYPSGEAGFILGALEKLILPNAIDTGLTLVEAIKLIVASAAGPVAISGTTVTIQDTTATIDRIVATTDGAGQRLTVAYNTT